MRRFGPAWPNASADARKSQDLPNVAGLAFFCLADMQVAEQIKIVEGATTQ
jgi:hypothetical protein